MTEWNGQIVISYGPFIGDTFVAIWDGSSQFPSVNIKTDGRLERLIDYNNRLVGFFAGRIYTYNGSDFEIAKTLPGDGVVRSGGSADDGSRILVVAVVITDFPVGANSRARANMRVVLPPPPTRLITSLGLISRASLSFIIRF